MIQKTSVPYDNHTVYVLIGDRIKKQKEIVITTLSDTLAIGNTCGVSRDYNEDCVGVRIDQDLKLHAAITDGHWGIDTAKIVLTRFLEQKPIMNDYPTTYNFLQKIETEIVKTLSKNVAGSDHGYNPETSLIYAQVVGDILHLASYGDCLAFIISNYHTTQLINTPLDTWFGIDSTRGDNNRVLLKDGLAFFKIALQHGDTLILLSDGAAEYKEDSLLAHPQKLEILHEDNKSAAQYCRKILDKALEFGSHDNASSLVYYHQ